MRRKEKGFLFVYCVLENWGLGLKGLDIVFQYYSVF